MKLLLDTCTFVWLCSDPRRLSAKVRRLVDQSRTELLLSDVSVLEISLKWQRGKIELPAPPRSWIEEQASTWQIRGLPVTRSIIYRSAELGQVHPDPFDRLLGATAIEQSATIATPDEALRRYPVACVWD
jgi:PIN domain nuclease of toxin-antitoxin system